MKKPNYGQQQKMKTLDPVALAAYCNEKGLEMPQTSTPVAQVIQHPHEPPVEEKPAPITVQEPSVVTSVTVTPPVETPPEPKSRPFSLSEEQIQLTAASNRFFDLKDHLIQNAAHSVLNWEEMADLEAILQPHRRREREINVKPAVIELPEGQRWAMIVGEPMNRCQKFIRFQDDEPAAPHKMLYVQYSQQRFMGRKVRVKKNPDETVGGYILA